MFEGFKLDRIEVGNVKLRVGDTRAYLVRGGEVFQITRDHTLVQSLLDEGGQGLAWEVQATGAQPLSQGDPYGWLPASG